MRWEDDDRLAPLLEAGVDIWSRSTPLHVTGSAIVVHPPTKRVLLRWHERYGIWNHVGGHADPDEHGAPDATARREAREETGLTDLRPFPGPDPEVVLVAHVDVPAAKGEPDHVHADVCYVLATDTPDSTVDEHDDAALRWVSIAEARTLVNDHVCALIERVARLLD
jgi:8-oxo-dGTP pyrophosphatase MutT (NUDIX family)